MAINKKAEICCITRIHGKFIQSQLEDDRLRSFGIRHCTTAACSNKSRGNISKLVIVSGFEVSCGVLSTVTCMKEYEYSSECKVKGHNRSQERFRSCHFRHNTESEVIKSRMIEGRHITMLTEVMLVYSICSVLIIITTYKLGQIEN